MEEEIVLYTIGCIKCIELEKELNSKNIKYKICNDIEIMKKKGINRLPILQVNESMYNFDDAMDWVSER